MDPTLHSPPDRRGIRGPGTTPEGSDIPAAATAPRRGAVRLRWIQPEAASAADLADWTTILSAEERDRAARFRFDADRVAFIAAHALKRRMLSEQAGLPPTAWRFVAGPAGKPELDPAHGLPWLRFNLSHARSLVACAVAVGDDIGVDVESLDRRPPAAGLAARWFAPEENALLGTLPEPGRTEAFLKLWTLKEAFVKATGDGIALGIERVVFALDPPCLLRAPPETGAAAAWRVLQIAPEPRHVLSVALRRRHDDGLLAATGIL
jgi:4'-phosphopantetheinyl transferase